MARKSPTADIDEAIQNALDEAGVPAVDPRDEVLDTLEPVPAVEGQDHAQPDAGPTEGEPPGYFYQPPERRTGIANWCTEGMPPLGSDAHDVLVNLLGFHEYWIARSDPADFAHHIGVRIKHLLGRTPKRAA